MKWEHFKDIKVLEQHISKRTLGMLKARQQVVSWRSRTGYFMKSDYNFEDTPENTTFISLEKGRQSTKGRGKGRGRPKELSLAQVRLSVKYERERMLKAAKVKDLASLIPMITKPEDKQWFQDLVERQRTLHTIYLEGETEEEDDSDLNVEEDPDNPDNTILIETPVWCEDSSQ